MDNNTVSNLLNILDIPKCEITNFDIYSLRKLNGTKKYTNDSELMPLLGYTSSLEFNKIKVPLFQELQILIEQQKMMQSGDPKFLSDGDLISKFQTYFVVNPDGTATCVKAIPNITHTEELVGRKIDASKAEDLWIIFIDGFHHVGGKTSLSKERISKMYGSVRDQVVEKKKTILRSKIKYNQDLEPRTDRILRGLLSGLESNFIEDDLLMLKHWMWQVKRRFYDFDTLNEIMITISGKQGTGKTLLAEGISGLFKGFSYLEGGVKELDSDNGMFEKHSQNNFIYGFDEIGGLDTERLKKLKNAVTTTNLAFRKYHTQTDVACARTASYIATSNVPMSQIIRDDDNRRFYEIASNLAEGTKASWINKPGYLINERGVGEMFREAWKGIDEDSEIGYWDPEIQTAIRHRMKGIAEKPAIAGFVSTVLLGGEEKFSMLNNDLMEGEDAYGQYKDFCASNGYKFVQSAANFYISFDKQLRELDRKNGFPTKGRGQGKGNLGMITHGKRADGTFGRIPKNMPQFRVPLMAFGEGEDGIFGDSITIMIDDCIDENTADTLYFGAPGTEGFSVQEFLNEGYSIQNIKDGVLGTIPTVLHFVAENSEDELTENTTEVPYLEVVKDVISTDTVATGIGITHDLEEPTEFEIDMDVTIAQIKPVKEDVQEAPVDTYDTEELRVLEDGTLYTTTELLGYSWTFEGIKTQTTPTGFNIKQIHQLNDGNWFLSRDLINMGYTIEQLTTMPTGVGQ